MAYKKKDFVKIKTVKNEINRDSVFEVFFFLVKWNIPYNLTTLLFRTFFFFKNH